MDTDPDRIRFKFLPGSGSAKMNADPQHFLRQAENKCWMRVDAATTYQELASSEGILVKAGVHFTGRIMD
jgi:hypothetical protein